jgi:hypothetical protein
MSVTLPGPELLAPADIVRGAIGALLGAPEHPDAPSAAAARVAAASAVLGTAI